MKIGLRNSPFAGCNLLSVLYNKKGDMPYRPKDVRIRIDSDERFHK